VDFCGGLTLRRTCIIHVPRKRWHVNAMDTCETHIRRSQIRMQHDWGRIIFIAKIFFLYRYRQICFKYIRCLFKNRGRTSDIREKLKRTQLIHLSDFRYFDFYLETPPCPSLSLSLSLSLSIPNDRVCFIYMCARKIFFDGFARIT